MVNTVETTTSTIETCIALEDFIYGYKVKVSIPTLHHLLDKDNIF